MEFNLHVHENFEKKYASYTTSTQYNEHSRIVLFYSCRRAEISIGMEIAVRSDCTLSV